MKTKLPLKITSVAEAEAFYRALVINHEAFHPEDDAFEIVWKEVEISSEEKLQLNKLNDDVYSLPEMEMYPKNKWDPCGFIMKITEA